MAKRLRMERPLAVKEVLQEWLRPGDWQVLELHHRIRSAWEAALPPALQTETRLVDFKRHELWVEVSSSAWAQELQFLKPKLLAALAREVGPHIIKEVRFRVGATPPSPPTSPTSG